RSRCSAVTAVAWRLLLEGQGHALPMTTPGGRMQRRPSALIRRDDDLGVGVEQLLQTLHAPLAGILDSRRPARALGLRHQQDEAGQDRESHRIEPIAGRSRISSRCLTGALSTRPSDPLTRGSIDALGERLKDSECLCPTRLNALTG